MYCYKLEIKISVINYENSCESYDFNAQNKTNLDETHRLIKVTIFKKHNYLPIREKLEKNK